MLFVWAAPKALVAAGAPKSDVDGAACCCPKNPPVVGAFAVVGWPKMELVFCWGVAENPPNPVVPAGLAAPNAVVPACPNRVVLGVAVLAPNTDVLAWGWKPGNIGNV